MVAMQKEEREPLQQPAEEQEEVIERELFRQGAEARVFETTFMGRTAIVKERFSKKYRHPVLDSKLTSKRLLGEARSVAKARRLGVRTPALYAVDPATATLTFEFIPGLSVKELLFQSGPLPSPDGTVEEVASQIGETIARLHDGGVIHGDLTTSNMLLQAGSNQLVMIDFGLAFTSTLPEDKAVDLYVLERALIALHSSNGDIEPIALDISVTSFGGLIPKEAPPKWPDFEISAWEILIEGKYHFVVTDQVGARFLQTIIKVVELYHEQARCSALERPKAGYGWLRTCGLLTYQFALRYK